MPIPFLQGEGSSVLACLRDEAPVCYIAQPNSSECRKRSAGLERVGGKRLGDHYGTKPRSRRPQKAYGVSRRSGMKKVSREPRLGTPPNSRPPRAKLRIVAPL